MLGYTILYVAVMAFPVFSSPLPVIDIASQSLAGTERRTEFSAKDISWPQRRDAIEILPDAAQSKRGVVIDDGGNPPRGVVIDDNSKRDYLVNDGGNSKRDYLVNDGGNSKRDYLVDDGGNSKRDYLVNDGGNSRKRSNS